MAEQAADVADFRRADRTSRHLVRWVEFALIVAIFFIAGGAAAPHVNETHYLTKAVHYWNPSYCPGDLFLDSADVHLAFYWTLGWLGTWFSLPEIAWIGRVAAWMLLAVGWLRLANACRLPAWGAAATALAWIVLVDKCDFAGEWVVGGVRGKGGVEAKCFAYGFVLCGLATMARAQWSATWAWLGAAAAMHALVGGWSVLAAACVWATEPSAVRCRTSAMLPGIVAGGVMSLAGLLPALAADRGVSADVTGQAAAVYVFDRLPHHLAPLTLEPAELRARVLRFGAVVVALAILSVLVPRASFQGDGTRHTSRNADAPAPVGRIMRFAAFALLGNCVGLVIEMALSDRPAAAARLLRFYWFRQADVFVPAAVALGAAQLAVDYWQRSRPWTQIAVAVGVLACVGYLIDLAASRASSPEAPAVARMEDPDAWRATCAWIRDHAPPDALCLIPRHAQSFKWYAARADVVNWKDIPQDAASVVEWRRRCDDVFPTVDTEDGPVILGSPEQWGRNHVRDVARRYGARYVIARSEPPLGLRELYATSSDVDGVGYSIYDPELGPEPVQP